MRFSSSCLKIALAAMIGNLFPLSATSQTPGISDTSPRALVQKARGSIAVVTGEDSSGQPIARGLGFVIGRTLIATHSRVVLPELRLYASLPGQESSPIKASYSDGYRMTAIMTMSTPYLSADSLTLGDSDKVAPKDRAYLFSDPGPQAEILDAVVTRITTINGRRYFELSAPFKESMRGGPVFNDRGEVIGILSQSPEPSLMSLALPASYLTTLLKARTPEAAGGPGPGSGVKITTTRSGSGAGSGGGTGTSGPPSTGPGPPSTGPGVGPGLPSAGPGAGPGLGSSPREGASTAPAPVTKRPKAINSVHPQYSEIARRNQTHGVVMMRLLVGADGDVKQAKVTKGLPDDLNEQALDAAYKLKFEPATRDGVAVDYTISIEVAFYLR